MTLTEIVTGSLAIHLLGAFDKSVYQVAGDLVENRADQGCQPRAYILVRDQSCRLFGYHGLVVDGQSFSLDHMFGF
jgi:hypothetical protein